MARAAWESVPFRPVPYAEDHVLAHDMMRAGYAKVYVPDAAVIHSHEYSAWNWLRRVLREYRALSEVYGFVPPLDLRWPVLRRRGTLGRTGVGRGAERRLGSCAWPTLGSSRGHCPTQSMLRTAGSLLGARADRLPAGLAVRSPVG